jgi:hypothetical protein
MASIEGGMRSVPHSVSNVALPSPFGNSLFVGFERRTSAHFPQPSLDVEEGHAPGQAGLWGLARVSDEERPGFDRARGCIRCG